jgi:IS5 family transposase
MAERQIGQLSFTDGLVNETARANASLQRMAELVDWPAVEALLSGLRSESMGAPGYPALALFKALLLQQWYGLSDPGLAPGIDHVTTAALESNNQRARHTFTLWPAILPSRRRRTKRGRFAPLPDATPRRPLAT